jgi:predicted GIY-YIG superfamily endonuclease
MDQHAIASSGGYTARRRPIELVFSQEFGTRAEALSDKFQMKGWA